MLYLRAQMNDYLRHPSGNSKGEIVKRNSEEVKIKPISFYRSNEKIAQKNLMTHPVKLIFSPTCFSRNPIVIIIMQTIN